MSFATLLRAVALVAAPAASMTAMPATALAQPADFKPKADALVEASYPADGPGAAVIVMRGGRVVYSAGRGLADVEARLAITPDTHFRLGSIAKQFTAALVLRLAADGTLSLEDPVSRFFPDWPQPGGSATVRQLLNHTSGIPDFSKIPGWIARNRHRPWTTAELLAVFRDLPAKAQPGHAWEYNNGGYVMLGAIVEKVTGKAWHEALAERITGPLGLTSIAYAPPEKITPASARGYTREGGRAQPVQLSHMSLAHAAGGLSGSVSDMARWAQALHHGRVLTPALYQEMSRPAPLAGGRTETYGMGLRLRRIRGRPALVHGGAGGGLDTDSAYIPSEDLFVAVFANSDEPATDPAALVRRLAALALGDPIPSFTPAPIDMAAVQPLFGVYEAKEGGPLRFFARDGKLYLGQGEDQREALPAGGDRFFFGKDDLSWVRFVRQPGGAHHVEMHGADEAQPKRAVRTGDVPAPFTVRQEVLRTYVGRYATEVLAVTVALDGKGGLTMTPQGQSPMPLRPVSNTEFRIDGGMMRVVFHPEKGSVDRFTLYRGARELHGRRTGR
jgi:CubicO group peptidase (beta-lactamase class C family)